MSNNDEHMELMNARLRVIESHLVENYKVLEDIRDVLLILAGSSPVPTREDASRERHPSGDTRVRRGTLSRQDGPVLRVAEGPDPHVCPSCGGPLTDMGIVEQHTPNRLWRCRNDCWSGYEIALKDDPEQEYGPPDAPISARTSERVMQMVNCAHKWPGIELTSDVECERCGLPYGQWSVGENR